MNWKVASNSLNGAGLALIIANIWPDFVRLGPLLVVAAISVHYWLVKDHS